VPFQPAPSSDSALRLAVDLRRLPWVRRLAADYAFDYAALAPFFAGDPSEPASWTAAIGRRLERDAGGSAVASIVAAQQARRHAPAEAVAAAARLNQPGAVAIVTGQQAGLFGGPLFTLLKAITTIRLAERVAREHEVPVVPVFWIDAEDHDWAEVSSCAVLDGDLVLQRISAEPPEGAGERMVGSLSWTDRIEDTRAALGAVLPDTEFAPWLLGLLEETYRPGHSVCDAFARLIERLLGPHGLVVYDSSDPAAKPLVASVFAEELAHPGRTSLLAARAGADLVSRGYHMQVTPHADHAALFAIDGGRRAIRSAGEGFAIGDEEGVPRDALIDRARRNPAAFSPNVLLRPIVQDTLFPTVAYVAGPNELAYLAQLRGVYESFGVPMPLMAGRATATLVDSAALRFLTRYDVAFESLREQDEHALNELLRALLPPSVERSIDEAERALAERMDAVIAALPSVDPTLEGKGRSVLGRMEHELQTLRAKILQAAKRRDETLRRQFLHTRAQAFPVGEPQERVVSGASFLARYGPTLVDRLGDELPLEMGTHWVVAV
jgi:bacillithiol biosynthesis cysteine-adding enzyme BshC